MKKIRDFYCDLYHYLRIHDGKYGIHIIRRHTNFFLNTKRGYSVGGFFNISLVQANERNTTSSATADRLLRNRRMRMSVDYGFLFC